MKLMVLAIGKLREPYYRDGVGDYLERIRKFLPIEMREVAAVKGENVVRKEAETLLRALTDSGKVIALDVGGSLMSTENLRDYFLSEMNGATSQLTFVLGGAFGLDDSVLKRADKRLSLSPLTLPHELARLVLVEQIYRVLTLWKGLPYHK
jgi:23S rRNA (pseudouridine1915-N3)-methyltransferase